MPLFTDVPCTACGCVCDDLSVQVEGPKLTPVLGACRLAEAWFGRFNNQSTGVARHQGKECSYEHALTEAAAILTVSQAPLIYGLSRSSTGGQRAAVALAEQLGAVIDTTASVCHGPSIMAIQEVGESTCSLGEISQRADLVIFWGANPVVSHPRHLERYSADPSSFLLPEGRHDRTVVVIDIEETETARIADDFIRVEPGRDFEFLWQLRAAVAGIPQQNCPAAVEKLARQMKSCRYGVVFFGLGIAQAHLGHRTVVGVLKLVAELNRYTRFAARRLRIPGDVSGADSVLCWQTGYPFAVDFSRGYPRYQPDEYIANRLLERGDVDACLLIGAESLIEFSAAARSTLAQIPTVVLDPPFALGTWPATVEIATATYGVHAPGTAYRMDEIPIPLRTLTESSLPTDEPVLNHLNRLCAARLKNTR